MEMNWKTSITKKTRIYLKHADLEPALRATLAYLTDNKCPDLVKRPIDFDLLFDIRAYLHDDKAFSSMIYKKLFPAAALLDLDPETQLNYFHDGCIYTFNEVSRMIGAIPYQAEKDDGLTFSPEIPANHFRFSYCYKNEVDHFLSGLIIYHINNKNWWFQELGLLALCDDLIYNISKECPKLPDALSKYKK